MNTKSNKFLLVSLLVLLPILSACGATNAPTATPTTIPVIIYSDEAYPPYAYQENGEAKGIYVDILKVAFSRLSGYTVTIEPVPWKRGLGYMEAGIGLGIFPPYYRPDTRPWMGVSVPILDESLTLFCTSDVLKTPRPNWPQDYAGLKIGNNLGFATFKESQEELAQYNISIEEINGTEANLLKLARREIDCYNNDKLSVLWELQRLKANGAYKPGATHAEIVEALTLHSEQGHLGYTLTDKGAFTYKDDFKTQLDKILTDMKNSGEIQQIIEQFINQQ